MRSVAVEIDVDQDGRHVRSKLSPKRYVVKNSLSFPQLASALTATADDLELPAVPGANQAISIDKSVGNPPAVVRAFVANHDEPPAAEPRDTDPLGALARRDDLAGLDATREHVADLRHPIIGVIAELVMQPCGERAHPPTLRPGSDRRMMRACGAWWWRWCAR